MTQARLILDLAEYAIWFAFLASALFPLFTSYFWPWWKTTWGWNIVTLDLGVALALLPSWLRLAFGLRTAASYPFAWIAVASVFAVGVIVTWRTVLIWRTQRKVPDDS